MAATPWIYRYEVKGIQGFILSTNRLKEIKGGSALVEDLPELLQRALKAQRRGGLVLYAAAGGATLQFPDEPSVRDFAAYWPMIVAQYAPGLPVVQAYVPLGDDALAHLHTGLQKQQGHTAADLPEAGPIVARAPRTGLPALSPLHGPRTGAKQGESLFDPATAARLAAATATTRRDPLWSRLVANAPTDSPLRGMDFSLDLEEIPTAYIAVLHADGNDMGAAVRSVSRGGIDALRTFSSRLSEATTSAAATALDAAARWLMERDRMNGRVFHARPVVLGGDDFTLIIRADAAFECARRYLEEFEKCTSDLSPDGAPLSACAGIALVHPNFPFHLAHELAEDLCGYAKESVRDLDGGRTPSALHWHRVTTAHVGRYREEILDRELACPGQDGGPAYLTCGPYLIRPLTKYPTLDALDGLRGAIEGDSLPQSALTDVIRLLQSQPIRAFERLQRLEEVLQTTGREAAWNAFAAALLGLGCDRTTWISRPLGGEMTAGSPLLDALIWQRMIGSGSGSGDSTGQEAEDEDSTR